jgi:hypothetical protein
MWYLDFGALLFLRTGGSEVQLLCTTRIEGPHSKIYTHGFCFLGTFAAAGQGSNGTEYERMAPWEVPDYFTTSSYMLWPGSEDGSTIRFMHDST